MLRVLVERLGQVTPAGAGDVFVSGPAAGVFDRVYGGQSLSEALMAAAGTAPVDRRFHAVHCHFLRLGDPARTTEFRVERLGDARSFAVRQVRAEQDGRLILVATFSFAAPSEGIAHQRPAPDAPPPEAAPSRDEELIALHGTNLPVNAGVPWPIDIRHLDQRPWDETIGSGHHRLWMRADEALPDDPLLHAALLLYASDLTMADAVTVQHPIRWEDLIAGRDYFGASLDHAFWLHAPARMDDWLLHEQESSRAADGRGFATGRFFDRSGVLVASVAQEIFIRAAKASAA
jgi:acyl-CoA thioesterase-2